jgi:hypothetical protein
VKGRCENGIEFEKIPERNGGGNGPFRKKENGHEYIIEYKFYFVNLVLVSEPGLSVEIHFVGQTYGLLLLNTVTVRAGRCKVEGWSFIT